MTKHFQNLQLLGLVLTLFLSLTLAACGGDEATGTPVITTTQPATTLALTTSPNTTVATANSGGLTMQTAFQKVDPQVKMWKADAVYISIFNPEGDQVGIDSGGHAPVWFFEALSPADLQHSFWSVTSAANATLLIAKTAEDTLPKDLGQTLLDQQLPAVTKLIDTDKLMQIARQNGGGKSDRPVGLRLARTTKADETLAFDLLFYTGDDVVRLRIDAQTGKPIENVKG